MKKKTYQTHQFCHALLHYGSNRCRAMANFVMALAGNTTARSIVGLSDSRFCHYHYSNLAKVMEYWEIEDKNFGDFIAPYLPAPRYLESGTPYYAMTGDITKALKEHSVCLEDRQYVATSNNVIASNRALGVGYPVSCLHLGAGEAGWCPPLALQRVGSGEDTNEVALGQVRALLRCAQLPFGENLCLLRTDTGFGKAVFLAPLYEFDDLVNITRLRAGMKVWHMAPDADPTGGAKRIYGDKYYLTDASQMKTYRRKGQTCQVWQAALGERPADAQMTVLEELQNGRAVRVNIQRWENMLIRSKDGANMKNKPFDVLRIQVLDAQTLKPVFERPMFLALSGKRRREVSLNEARTQYRERYDVEPFYRFCKQNLMLDKFQTPDVEHFDKWLYIQQITVWLMFTARNEIRQNQCPVWQQYLPKNKHANLNPLEPLTIAQTQMAIHSLFSTLDPGPFLPLKSKKGKGRAMGQTFPPRKRFKVVKKSVKNIRKLKKQRNE